MKYEVYVVVNGETMIVADNTYSANVLARYMSPGKSMSTSNTPAFIFKNLNRDGLISDIKSFIDDNHKYLVNSVKLRSLVFCNRNPEEHTKMYLLKDYFPLK